MPEPGPVLLITRPEPAGAAFALSVIEALRRPVTTILSPLMEIVPVAVAVPDPLPAGIVLTSAHGAEAAGGMGWPPGLTAWCVGARTAEAARAAGLTPVSADGDAAALVRLILTTGVTGPLLHLRGAHVASDVATALTGAGVPCAELVCYRQEARPLSPQAKAALAGPAPVMLPLFSPRTVSIMARNAPFAGQVTAIAISEAVAQAAEALRPGTIIRATRPDAEAMREATCRAIAANSMSSGA